MLKRMIDVGGEQFHCVEMGSGPTVVLLHGMPAFWFSFRHQLPALADAGYRAVAVDLLGHNLSSKPRGIAAYDDNVLLERTAQLLSALDAEHLVGHDRGGWLAWMLAMHRPARLRSLTVIAVPHPRRMRESLFRWDQLRRSWYTYMLQVPRLPEWLFQHPRVVRRVVSRNRLTPIRASDLAAYVQAAALSRASMFHYYRANARAVLRKDPLWWAPQLPSIRAPTLLLWPTHDQYIAPRLAQPYEEDVPHLRVAHLRGGHWLHEDNPEDVNRELLQFLARVRSRDQAEHGEHQDPKRDLLGRIVDPLHVHGLARPG